MNRLVSAELLKLRTTRATVGLALAGIGIAVLLGIANASIAGDPGTPALGSAPFVEDVVGVSAIPAAIAALLGVLLAAGEHQHGTIVTTFLATPRRRRVVAAKALAAGIGGSVVAVAMVAASAVAAGAIVVAEGASVDVDADVGRTLVGLLAGSAILGAGGALLGLLVRSQVGAVVAVVTWMLVVEAVADTVTGGALGDWLPGVAAASLAGAGDRSLLAAGAVVLAWVAAIAAVTVPLVDRREVE